MASVKGASPGQDHIYFCPFSCLSTRTHSLFLSLSPLLLTETFSFVLVPGRLMVLSNLTVVADELETANHLADGKESQTLGGNDTAGGELSSAEITDLVNEVLRRLENGAGLDGTPQVLVVGLEGGH